MVTYSTISNKYYKRYRIYIMIKNPDHQNPDACLKQTRPRSHGVFSQDAKTHLHK